MSLNLRVTIAKGIPCKVSSTSRGVRLCTLNLVLILFVSVSPYILDGLVLLPRRKMHTPLNLASVASASYPSLAPAEFCTTSPHRRYQNIFCEWSSLQHPASKLEYREIKSAPWAEISQIFTNLFYNNFTLYLMPASGSR